MKYSYKVLALFMLAFCFMGMQATAQDQKVSGTVTSASDGLTLFGVNVTIKGAATGTITDIDGKYQLNVSEGTSLTFSYVGFADQTIEVGNQSTIDVQMVEGTALSEIVVTALGIKKSKKSLAYAIENVNSEELLQGNQTNLVNALQGKVAGVSVTNSGGAPGASSVILIRGGNSLSGNNQPLFVVDGIPIDNSTESGASIATSNRALDLNSEDIESVSILKGPAAAALYGIKAANGAVVITTKSGKAGKAEISYSGSISVDNVIATPEIQREYGQGTKLDDGTISDETTLSWADTKLAASTPTYDNLAIFYQSATTHNHNLSYSGGSEKSTLYLSAGYLDQKGVIEHSGYKRTSVKIKSTSKLKENLTVSASINYVNSKSDRTRQGSANSGNFRSILAYPINVDMTDYLNEDGTQKYIEGLGDAPNDNPYWSAVNNPVNNRIDRFISVGSVTYTPFDFMDITYRLGTDIFSAQNKSTYAFNSSTFDQGYIGEYTTFNQITTSTVLLNLHKQVNAYNFGLTLGNNVEDAFRRKTFWSGSNFIEPEFIGINNIVGEDRSVGQSISRRRIFGNFGELKADWKSIVFVNVTGRYDKSSTLPKDANGFFYPSVGMSIIASELLTDMGVGGFSSNSTISYWKVRANWAQVGKDAPPHVLVTPMASSTNSFTVDPGGFIRAVYPTGNPGIRPEFTNAFEIGTDIRLFHNRLSIDFSYFNSTSDDQILFVRMPPSASTYGGYLNGGSITNKGIELLIGATAVKTDKLTWNINLNYSKIESHVNDLPGTIPQVEESGSWAFNNIAEGAAFLDGPLFGIFGKTYLRDESGNLLLDTDGMVQLDDQMSQIGNRAPDWTLGLTNTVKYNQLTLSFLWDVAYGNDVLNATRAATAYYGLSPETLNRNTTTVFEGLRSTGDTDDDGNIIYENNTAQVLLDQTYFQEKYATVGENFIEDGSWLRLRYVSLSYDLSVKGDRKAQVYFTGRNLLLFTNYTGVDPEINSIGASVKGTGSIGIDNLGTPSTKGFDVGFKFTF